MKFPEFFKKVIIPGENLSKLERNAGIPAKALHKYQRYLEGKKGGSPLRWDHIPAIVWHLCKTYGCIEIGEWTVRADQEMPVFFLSTKIPDREVVCNEIITEKGGSRFEYLEPQYRMVMDSFDLWEWMKED